MKDNEIEARRAFVVEVDAILSELLVINDALDTAQEPAKVVARDRKLRALRRYVLDIFDKGRPSSLKVV